MVASPDLPKVRSARSVARVSIIIEICKKTLIMPTDLSKRWDIKDSSFHHCTLHVGVQSLGWESDGFIVSFNEFLDV